MWDFIYKIWKIWYFVTGKFSISNILHSSHELDRKRKEIKDLSAILVLVLKQMCNNNYSKQTFEDISKNDSGIIGESRDLFWKIQFENNIPVGISLINRGSVLLVFSYHVEIGQSKLSYQSVGEVHSRLQDLVKLLVKNVNGFAIELHNFTTSHKNT